MVSNTSAESARRESPLQTMHDVACTACACVCDDLTITVSDGRIVSAERACSLAEPWFFDAAHNGSAWQAIKRRENLSENETLRKEGGPHQSIPSVEVTLDEAVNEAARILDRAISPLIYGLSRSSTAGQRAAVRLADHIGATIDTTASEGHAPSILAMQQVGESTCTLGEIRNRADLVIYWGADPVTSHPRHMERYSTDATGLFVPRGRADRRLIVIDSQRTATAELADRFIQVDESRDFEAIWALRCLLRGIDVPSHLPTGIRRAELRELAEMMKSCRCGVVFFGYGVARQPLGHCNVEALLRLTIDLNRFTRFHARRLRVVGDVAGADSVLCWQTGFPFSVNLNRGYPRYNPGEYSAADLLERGEVDAALFVGAARVNSFPAQALAHLRRIPTILLDGPGATLPFKPTLHIATASYGIHHPGTAYRMDEVPIPLRQLITSSLPTDAAVLQAITRSTAGEIREHS